MARFARFRSLLALLVLLTLLFSLVPRAEAAAPAWDGNYRAYGVGDVVSYQNAEYRCIQAHTSQPGWDPAAVPALWQRLTTSPTATPTRTAGPTATRPPATATPRPATATPTRTAGHIRQAHCWLLCRMGCLWPQLPCQKHRYQWLGQQTDPY